MWKRLLSCFTFDLLTITVNDIAVVEASSSVDPIDILMSSINGSPALLTGVGRQKCKASTVLNKSAEFAVSNVFDGSDDTCWNSDQVTDLTILAFSTVLD